jgi:uncharacterized protein (DUF1501 family)
MKSSKMKFDRRTLLTGGAAVLGGAWLAGRASASGALPHLAMNMGDIAGDEPPRTLLVLELSGGNDGLDTIVPFADDIYHKSRARIGLPTAEVLRFDDYRAFNPGLREMRRLYGEGRVAIIEGTGYPHPNRSHFTSQDIWYTASERGRAAGDGWIGRLTAALYPNDRRSPHLVHVGTTKPYSLRSSTHPVVFLDSPSAYRFALDAEGILASSTGGAMRAAPKQPKKNSAMPGQGMESDGQGGASSRDTAEKIGGVVRSASESSDALRRAALAYKPRFEYPDLQLGHDLKTAAALLQGNVGVRVLSVTQSGYDTHDSQRQRHSQLIAELDGCLGAFLADVWGTPAGDNLAIVVFSEFGRRVEDNASGGTDHGVAGPMFVIGAKVKGGLYGKHPSLTDLDDGDLVHTTDFRSVYASAVHGWLGLDAPSVLAAQHPEILLFA